MDAGKKENKSLRLKLVIWLLILLSGGQLISQVLYFQTYTDIVKNNPILPGDIKIPPFWRVIYDGARIQEMALIDSSGRLVEKRVNTYDARGNLARMKIYRSMRLQSEILYQPDSLQANLLRKLTAGQWFCNQSDLITEIHYDSTQHPTEVLIKDFSGSIIGIIEYQYNQRGDLVLEKYFAGERKQLLEYSEFEFILPDSIQTVRQYDGVGNLKSQVSLRIFK